LNPKLSFDSNVTQLKMYFKNFGGVNI